MPHLPARFSAYPVTVTLDGNGDGSIRFQATGQNIRITNLYVAVATRTAQAVCTMYKNQVGAPYAIKSTNSGSTGAAATGSIDLLDGESVYVVWDGGDPGALATATFSGSVIPFDRTPTADTSFIWDDPIAAGDGSLIYPGLQSIGYVAGVSGWRIDRQGNAEFNDAVIRGDLFAGNGTVQVNELGVYVTDNNSIQQYVILRDGGFVARNVPDNGQYAQMYVNGMVVKQSTVSANGYASTYSRFDANSRTIGAEDWIQANVTSGTVNGKQDSNLLLRSGGSGATEPYVQIDSTSNGTIDLTSQYTNIARRLISSNMGMDYPAAQLFSTTMTIAADGTLQAAKGATNYPVAFPAGTTVFGKANITSGSGLLQQIHVRFLPVSNTQYNLVWFRPAAVVGSGGQVIPIDVLTYVVPG